MDASFYKFLHVSGIITLFFAFGGLTMGSRLVQGKEFLHRRLYSILHGVGLLLIIVSGFGMKAKLDIVGWPSWLVVKLVIWLCLGLSIALVLRNMKLQKYVWLFLILLGSSAALLAVMH